MWINSFPGQARALDIAAANGLTAQGWWGTQLATSNPNVLSYNKSFDVWRNSDGTTFTAGWLPNGDVDAASIDNFCAPATSCEISKAYDQSYNISTLAMAHNDSTQTPGFILLSATVLSGGTCSPDGSYTFSPLAGGTGSVNAVISGTVTGGALSGALTISDPGSYTSYNTNIPAQITAQSGGTCTVNPTATLGYTQQAPLWTTNVVNGHRSLTFTDWYGGGNQYGVGGSQGSAAGQLFGVTEWLNWPTAITLHRNSASLLWSGQARTSLYNRDNVVATFGPEATGYRFAISAIRQGSACSTTTNIPTPSFFCDQNTSNLAGGMISPYSSANVWTLVASNPTSTVTAGNQVGTIPTSNLASPTITGGNTGPGINGGGLTGLFDMLSEGVFDGQIPVNIKNSMIGSMNVQGGMTPQAPIDLFIIADSQMMGFLSTTGQSSPKYLTQLNLLNASVNVVNLSFPGGQYVGGAYDYTANFVNNWLPVCNPSRDQYAFMNLGVNDIGTGATDSVTYTRAQNYAAQIALSCPTIKVIQGTLPYKVVAGSFTSQMASYVAAYNATVIQKATLPISLGGLGAYGLIDLYNDPLFSQGQNTVINYVVQQSGHLNIAGATEEAWSMARGFNVLLK